MGAVRPLRRQLDRLSGRRGGIGDEAIRALHAIGSHGFLPDRTLLLQLAAEEADARAQAARRRRAPTGSARATPIITAAVAAAFEQLAAAEPDRFRLIDAGGTPDEVDRARCSPRSRTCCDAALRP